MRSIWLQVRQSRQGSSGGLRLRTGERLGKAQRQGAPPHAGRAGEQVGVAHLAAADVRLRAAVRPIRVRQRPRS